MRPRGPVAPMPAPRRILVVMLADAGDLLLATPALRALRATYPQAHLALLTKPSSLGVLAGQGLVDAILPFDKHLFDRPRALLQPVALAMALRFLWRLRRSGYDTVLLFHHLTLIFGALKYAGVLLATGAAVRAGLDNGRGSFLTHRVADGGFGARHQADYWLEVAAAVGARPAGEDDGLPAYSVVPGSREEARQLLAGHGVALERSLLVLHPGSGGYSAARRWPAERFAAVARDLGGHEGLLAVVVGGADERGVAAEVAALVPGAVSVAGRTEWPVLAALLEEARLVVANDGGVAHLAGAVGTPLVVIFGPSNDAAWRPPGPRTRVVRAWLPCVPCFYRGHSLGSPEGCPPRSCLQQVGAAAVVAAGRALLGGEGRTGQRASGELS
ncbi:MAG: lipopolysaccharide heptosyltransferase II [Chloroflexota bacterium]